MSATTYLATRSPKAPQHLATRAPKASKHLATGAPKSNEEPVPKLTEKQLRNREYQRKYYHAHSKKPVECEQCKKDLLEHQRIEEAPKK